MAKDLTISIVNYNMKEHILSCLESIFSTSHGLDIDVYVVDNKSEDDSVEAIKRHYPKANLIVNNENKGFGKANNQVLSISDSRYCLITNPDVIVLPGTLQTMVGFMDENRDAGAAGCKMLNNDDSLQYSCRRYPTLFTLLMRGVLIDELFFRGKAVKRYLMQDWTHDEIRHVDWLTGCCIMLRKEAIEEVGLFDEKFFIYFEDVDICYRINRNWKVYYLPQARMIHEYQHKSRRIHDLKSRYYHLKSAIHFFRKNGLIYGGNHDSKN
jgi:GT2 family glycosyltransferase